MKARAFDETFDAGEDVSGDVDWDEASRPNLRVKRVNVDFPAWVVEALAREALVKLWITKRLERAA